MTEGTVFAHYPRVCAICGKPALITKQSLTFETRVPGVPLTYHSECRKAERDGVDDC